MRASLIEYARLISNAMMKLKKDFWLNFLVEGSN